MPQALTFKSLEGRVRNLTEDFKITQWVLLYHGQGKSSFFFRRGGKTENESRVDIAHSDHPNFFKKIFSVVREWKGTMEEISSLESSTGLYNQIFDSSFSRSPDRPVWVLQVNGIHGKKPLATFIVGDRRVASPSAQATQQRLLEKKMLLKLIHLLNYSLDMERHRIDLEADIRYREGEKTYDFKGWLDKVRKGIGAKDYHLYWLGENKVWIDSFSNSKPGNKLELFLKYWTSQQGIDLWNYQEIKVHAKIRSKITTKSLKPASLVISFPVPAEIVEKVSGNKDGKTHHRTFLAIQFVSGDPKKNFHDPEVVYAQKAWTEGKSFLNNPNLITSTKNAIQALPKESKEPKNSKESEPRTSKPGASSFHLYKKNQLFFAIPAFNTDRQNFIKTDLKTGLNIGNLPSYFNYFQIRKDFLDSEEGDALNLTHSGIDYFLSRSVDVQDYEKRLIDFLTNTVKQDPLERYAFLSLDSPTTSRKSPPKPSRVSIVSRGFHLLHYRFESGSLKNLPEFGYRLNLPLVEEDILLILPNTIKMEDSLFNRLRDELVIFGQAFPDKLVGFLEQLFHDQKFLVFKNHK